MIPTNVRPFLAVGLGSGLGAVVRFLCSLGTISILGSAFPWSTLIVNVLGSFLMGLHATLTADGGRLPAPPSHRQFVQAGFCGGFTTFSIFSLETLQLLEQSAFTQASLNVLASVVFWITSVWAGFQVGQWLNHKAR